MGRYMAHEPPSIHDQRPINTGLATATIDHPDANYIDHGEEIGERNGLLQCPLQFSKLVSAISTGSTPELTHHISPSYRKESLLTRALTSPELIPMSDIDAPLLTSDGDLTSPARTITPSPPLPALAQNNLAPFEAKDLTNEADSNMTQELDASRADRSHEVKVEEGLGRRRCISFACAQKPNPHVRLERQSPPKSQIRASDQTPDTHPKRPCMLRFACPMKSTRNEHEEHLRPVLKPILSNERNVLIKKTHTDSERSSSPKKLWTTNSQKTNETALLGGNGNAVDAAALPDHRLGQDLRAFNRIDFQKSEATRFHEFAGSFTEEDEWTKEQTAFRQRITISDTLRKENVIRRLAEEAEQEVLDEDVDIDSYSVSPDLDSSSNGGNETDDEEGFGDSEDESDICSHSHLWTSEIVTAATSTDHVEQFHAVSRKMSLESSNDCSTGEHLVTSWEAPIGSRTSKQSSTAQQSRIEKSECSETHDMLDSSDFVVGTIDEDGPLQEQYMSCRRQRQQSRRKLIPQDIDPSFPTSIPESDHDDDDEQVGVLQRNDRHRLRSVVRQRFLADDPNDSEDTQLDSHQRSVLKTKRQTPIPSPKRLHSPPPPTRRLFSQGVHRTRSPPPLHRRLVSPRSSRRQSPIETPSLHTRGLDIARLAQRPNLTHTSSLPRTPNPFWNFHRRPTSNEMRTPSVRTSPNSSGLFGFDKCTRGPIEIVQGLENKRQRRKEKFWRQHCKLAHAGKEKERKCQPGKGAQRMREVGLEMADRFRGYKQGAKLVLSV